MADFNAEQFAQRAYDLGLVEMRKLESVWADLGSREVPADKLRNLLVRREVLTNWQIERLLEGKRQGYFYGNYKVLYSVGAGTFARVYRAVHKETEEVRAVKVLRQRYSDDMTKTEQFMREASMVIPLRHPNIVPIYEVQSERGRHFMVMDFVEGQNLRDWVKMRKRLPLDMALKMIADVLRGLDYAFKRGVTHRDMKLSNVLVSSSGASRLVDFGLAAIEGETNDDALANVSNARSIDYAALERGTAVRKDDKRSDIYFVGCMLYHLLSGESPLHETRDRLQRLNVTRFREVKPIATLMPELPQRVAMVVGKAMELKADQRYQTPGDMLSDVHSAAKSITEGDVQAAQVSATAVSDAEQPLQEPQKLEGDERTLLIVEGDMAIQNALRKPLKRLGYRVLIISDPQRALERFEYDTDVADCVIFSAIKLGASAVQAFNKFAGEERTREIPTILILDRQQKKLAEAANMAKHRRIIWMPLKFRDLRVVLRSLLLPEANG